ncbi:thioredoxin-like [Anomaloglossus baeobatrachus]|uniref:thioredoxin-like n=1 Tax=Anomaloglossus baeobatrachus TaxID=238106 RepID=UPI003F4FA9A6
MVVQEVHEEHELQELLRNSGRKLVVVAFSSGSCGPCRLTTPCLEALSCEMPDVVFVKVDVRKSDEFVERYEISGVPAFCFFRMMNQVYKFQGGNVDFLCSKVHELRFQC